MHGLHHAFEHGIEKLPGLLGVAVGKQFHRALEVGEEHRDLLAFAFESAPGGEDLLGEVLRGIGLRGLEAWLDTSRQRCPALATEFIAGRIDRTA